MGKLINIDTEKGVVRIEVCLEKIGIPFDFVMLRADGFEVLRVGNDLTFDQLSELSRAFGTRNINLTCDTGTGSDPCHDALILVKDAMWSED
jgi:hypothetical protein